MINKKFFFLILLGLVLRLALALAFYGNFDQQSYEIVAGIVRDGGNIYAETSRYNYSPIWSYFLFVFGQISEFANLPMHFTVRGFLSIIELCNVVLIWRMSNQRNAILYWLNPASILLVGYHGQFEVLAILPILYSVYLRKKKGSGALIWLLGSLSLLIKHITMPGVWMLSLLQARNKLIAFLLMVTSIAVFLLSFLPYLPIGKTGILSNVLFYQSVPGN